MKHFAEVNPMNACESWQATNQSSAEHAP